MILRLATFAAVLLLFACSARAESLRVGDVTLHYVEAGRVESPALVLIPGWSCAAGIWKKQIAHFSKTMHVIAIDPRSQGDSAKTDDGNTPMQRARDYEALLEELKVENAVLVGWSQGVQDVASYVDQFGTRRLRGVVLVDAAVSKGARSVSANPEFVQGLLRNMDIYARHKREYLEGMMHAIFTQKMDDAEFNALVENGMKTPTNTGVAELAADMLGKDLTPSLKKFDKPTLVVASATSPEIAEQKSEAASLAHGSFVQVEHAGHGVFVDQPEAFNRALETFVASLPG